MAEQLLEAQLVEPETSKRAESIGYTSGTIRRKLVKFAGVGALATAGMLTPDFERYISSALQGTASLFPAGCAAMLPINTTIDDLIYVSYPQSAPKEGIDIFLKETKTAYRTLVDFLGVPKRRVDVTVGYFDKPQVNRYSGYQVLYPSSNLSRERHQAIWHELTHSLTQSSGEFYPEGLADYVRFRFGNIKDIDIHAFINQTFKQYGQKVSVLEIFNVRIGDNDFTARQSQLTNWVNYGVAASFVRYLAEDILKGDVKKFMEFFMAGDYSDAAHKKFFGKNLKELDAAWMEMLNSYGDKPKIFKNY